MPVDLFGDGGGRVAGLVAVRVTKRATGKSVDSLLAHFWHVEAGKAKKLVEIFDGSVVAAMG